MRLTAFVGLPDGSHWIRDELTGHASDPTALGASGGRTDARGGRGASCSRRRSWPRTSVSRGSDGRNRRWAEAAGRGGHGPAGSVLLVSGIVYLVGAGPGDPGLMTRRSLELIASADAILYDRLIPPGALDGARPDAELRYVGKEPGAPALTQEETNALLVALGRAGKRVVRLKGGDPFVFGRGGEEAEALAAAGVPFEVVPGCHRRRRGARVRGDTGHPPGCRVGGRVRHRPRGSREARHGARLGRARPLPRDARLLHGDQEPAADRGATRGRRAQRRRAGGRGGARHVPRPTHACRHAGRHSRPGRGGGGAATRHHPGGSGGGPARHDRLARAAAAPRRGRGRHARTRAGERARGQAGRAGRGGGRDAGDTDRAAPGGR